MSKKPKQGEDRFEEAVKKSYSALFEESRSPSSYSYPPNDGTHADFSSFAEASRGIDLPRPFGGSPARSLSDGIQLDGEPGLDGGAEPEELPAINARADITMEPFTATGRITTEHLRPKVLVIRNRAQVVRQSAILITVLQEALDYKRVSGGNHAAPELRLQLNLEDNSARDLIRELVEELKKLNAFLEARPKARRVESKIAEELSKIGLKVLKTYGTTVAVGAGILTIGALCSVLDGIGAHSVVENAKIWKTLGK